MFWIKGNINYILKNRDKDNGNVFLGVGIWDNIDIICFFNLGIKMVIKI